MKTLYITDLDGTLLNSAGKLTGFSEKNLSNLISDGLLFSISTARTAATVLDMFKNIKLNTPISLMNGVSIFDTLSGKSVVNRSIDKKAAEQIVSIYLKHNKHPMLYFDKGEYLEIVYTEIDNKHQEEYINDRNSKKFKKFRKISEYNLDIDNELLYIVSFDKPSELEAIHNEISCIDGVVSCFYADNYTDCNFLETMNSKVSKGVAAETIKKLTGADRIIAFGDNLNDIPLFRVADESYAVFNAHEELKKIATDVIKSNDEDAVIRFIIDHFNRN